MKSLTLPINLPKEAILEFIEIYKKHYQVDLNFEDAKRQAKRFMTMFIVVSQPISTTLHYQK